MSDESSVNPLKVPWRAWEAVLVFVLSWVGIPLLIILMFKYAAPYDANITHFLSGIRTGDSVASFQLTLLDALGGLALIAWILRKYKVGWDRLGLRKFDLLKAVLLIVSVFVFFILLASTVLVLTKLLLPGFNPNQAQVNEFTSAGPSLRTISFLALVIIPPIIEEIIFRGFMFPAFAGKWGIFLGALASSLLFGFAHLQANVGIYTVVLGLLLCYMYKRTGSIIPGMLLHMLNNYVAYAAIMGHK